MCNTYTRTHALTPQLPDDTRQCPPDLADLISHCWTSEPHGRPACAEVVERLERLHASATAAAAASVAARRRAVSAVVSSSGEAVSAGTAVSDGVPGGGKGPAAAGSAAHAHHSISYPGAPVSSVTSGVTPESSSLGGASPAGNVGSGAMGPATGATA